MLKDKQTEAKQTIDKVTSQMTSEVVVSEENQAISEYDYNVGYGITKIVESEKDRTAIRNL